MITDNATTSDARFDVEIYYTDGRPMTRHANVSAYVADRLETAFGTDPKVSQLRVTQCETAADDAHDETAERIRLTADAVLFGDFFEGRYVLLIERGWDPFAGCWALPGGHVDQGEETEDAARRELAEETGLHILGLEYVGTYAAVGRDPRGRYVTAAYVGRMPHREEPTAADDAARAEWVRLDDVLSGAVTLAFDHGRIIRDALKVARFYHT